MNNFRNPMTPFASLRSSGHRVLAKKEAETSTLKDIDLLTKELAEHEARLAQFKGGIKRIMKKTAVLSAFKSYTPAEAATAIQTRVRGRAAKRLVQKKMDDAISQDPQKALMKKTKAYAEARNIAVRLQNLRRQMQMIGIVDDAVAANRAPTKRYTALTSQRPMAYSGQFAGVAPMGGMPMAGVPPGAMMPMGGMPRGGPPPRVMPHKHGEL